MKKKLLNICVILIQFTSVFAQQTIKGKVVDLESQFPLPGAKNILNYSYAPNNDGIADDKDITENYQLGFLPIFYYRIDF